MRPLLWLVPLLLAACGEDSAPAVPEPPKDKKELTKLAQGALDRTREKLDKDARGLLNSFRARTYDPRRDGLIDHVEGSIRVRAGEVEGSYRFVYDAKNPADKPVTYDTVSEPPQWSAGVAADVRRWGLIACLGAYPIVAYQDPPLPLNLTRSLDGKNWVVTTSEFKTPLVVSYSLDDRQLVTIRGEWTDADHKFVTNYEWEDFHGRYLLRKATLHDGPVAEYEYEERDKLPYLKTVKLHDARNALEATFTYGEIRRRAK